MFFRFIPWIVLAFGWLSLVADLLTGGRLVVDLVICGVAMVILIWRYVLRRHIVYVNYDY